MIVVNPKRKSGSIFLILLLLLAIAGFFLVKAITVKSFSDAQASVEENFEDRYNPDSSRYSLSEHMGSPNTWKAYENKKFGYSIKYPQNWIPKQTSLSAGQLAKFNTALGSKVSLSVTVQNSFTLAEKTDKIKSNGIELLIFQNEKEAKAAVVVKNQIYYIIKLEEQNYFKGAEDFKGTFYSILKNFKFLD